MSVERLQTSIPRGQSASWVVSVWTTGGNVSAATVKLTAAPSGQTPKFSFGCGSHDGTASCALGAVDASSAVRQLQAQIAVASTATSVKSVQLTATGSTADVVKDPAASVAISVTAPGSAASSATAGLGPDGVGSQLSAGDLPFVNTAGLSGAGSELSPGGNASGLFPTVDGPPGASGSLADNPNARALADDSALPQGASVIGAQIAGLAVLLLAFVLAVTRLTIRRRSAPKPPAA